MDQWNLDRIRARAAWDLMPKKDGGIDWGDLAVAHIDTGISHHPVFHNYPAPAESPFLLPYLGLNLIEMGEQPYDSWRNSDLPGHGTRTCSVLCGWLEAGADSFMGVAPGVPTIPYRAVNYPVIRDAAAQFRIAHAIDHAVARNVSVISMSLGFPVISDGGYMGAAIDRAYAAGVIVAAAGGQAVDMVCYPAKYAKTIGCGGCTADDRVWYPYNPVQCRRYIDIWAPADDITRANTVFAAGQPDRPDVYHPDGPALFWGLLPGDKRATGTSYATAQVAGAAALWLRKQGAALDAAYGTDAKWRRIEAFRYLVGKTSRPMSGPDWDNEPIGVLDVEALLKADLPSLADAEVATAMQERKEHAAEIMV